MFGIHYRKIFIFLSVLEIEPFLTFNRSEGELLTSARHSMVGSTDMESSDSETQLG